MNKKKVTPQQIISMKGKQKIVMVTAYDYISAKLVDKTGKVDIILVGDSLGMVVQGHDNTLSVTMDQMIYHSEMVSRATSRALVVGDMPFMSYQVSVEDAVFNAGRFVKEGKVNAVKLEGGSEKTLEKIRAIIDAGIPVMGHLGLTPQSVNKFGGYRLQGKTSREAEMIIEQARKLEEAGVFSIVLEMVPDELSKKITEAISVPTIGIGAGIDCDGQVLVYHDILGYGDFRPSFVKTYANLAEIISKAISDFADDVVNEKYPSDEYTPKKMIED